MKYKDGIHQISNDDYHSSTAISRSQLMLLDKSPFHFWYEAISFEAEKKEPTPAMILGSAFHTMLLEPRLFQEEYIVKPEIEKLPPELKLKDVGREEFDKSKELRKIAQENNKKILEEFEENAQGKTILTQKQLEEITSMIEGVKRHDVVQNLLNDTIVEQSIFWTDKETGLQFKARPDAWRGDMIVDVKTTADASPYKMRRSALDNGYYLQAGMMYEGCKAVGKPFKNFVILACEKQAPFVPSVFVLDDEALQYGIDKFQQYKKKLAECLANNEWPIYKTEALTVPDFAVKELEREGV